MGLEGFKIGVEWASREEGNGLSYQHSNGGNPVMLNEGLGGLGSAGLLGYLSMRLVGPAAGADGGCGSLSWCRVFLVSACKAGSRGTGGRGSSRGITRATQGHGCH